MTEKEMIFPITYIPTIGEFLEALRIKPGGLGAQLFTSVYDQFFTWSLDLRNEYDRYYCVEYATLAVYLETAHEIQLEPADLAKRHILKMRSPGGVLDQAYDDNVLDTVISSIRELEANHED
jgi:hypothetical protein